MVIHIPRRPHLPARVPARSRRQLRSEALLPVRRSSGTNYPCTADELQDAIAPSPRTARSLITKYQAVFNLQEFNRLGDHITNTEHRAICRLEDAILRVHTGDYWSPDLVIKAFCDLDRVFFLGHLRGHVSVRYRPARAFPPETQHIMYMGKTEYLGNGRAAIYLNLDAIFADISGMNPFNEMWAAMIHEMCHAYEYIQVPQNRWGSEHGDFFGAKIHAVHDRALREINVPGLSPGESYGRIAFGPHLAR